MSQSRNRGTRPARNPMLADAVAVPKRLLHVWARELSGVEFGISMKMIGETWLVGRTAAPCPVDDLACWWGSIQRVVSPEEIREVLTRLVDLGVLLPVSSPPASLGGQGPLYAVNRDWTGARARY